MRGRPLLLAAVLALVAGGCAGEPRGGRPPTAPLEVPAPTSQVDRPASARKPAPGLAVTAVDGRRIDLASLRGRPVVVNFFESWCPQCREEQPALNRVADEFTGRVELVGVSFRDTAADDRAYARDYRVPYPLANDRSGRVWAAWGVHYQPVTFFVDRQGRIAARVDGQVQAARMRTTLLRLLAE